MSAMVIKGAVDRLDSDGAVGWFYASDYATSPVVRAYLNHDPIGDTVADTYRPDLEEVGFGDGRCGFEIRFHRPIDPTYLPYVTIKPDDIDLHLPLPSSNGTYLDVVNMLLGGFAGAGRSRSVLGGLWTDRADAPQVLAGRIAVGASPAELQTALQALIAHGHVVMHNALAPSGVGPRDLAHIAAATAPDEYGAAPLKPALTGVASLLFRDSVVRLLRTVFDDHPVAYQLKALTDPTGFGQASAFELLPSPGECLALYLCTGQEPVRIDIVRDSHELPEFAASGRSRWTGAGAGELGQFAEGAGLSIESIELDPLDVAIVSPGLVHRVVAGGEATALRALVSPRRVTPTRFLTGEGNWTEASHVSGGRVRI